MAETADATVTPLRPKSRAKAKDPTNATRQRRHRAKKTATPVTVSAALAENIPAETSSNIKATVTALPLPTLPASSSPAMPGTDTAPYTAPAAHNGADVMAYTAAIALAGAAAWFSIRGMVLLFPGAPLSVVGMACAMEVAKLVTAGWLARRWRSTLWVWRGVLVALVAALAVINAAGVYAQLVAAHIGERGAAVSAIETQDATLAARIDVAAGRLADLDRQISQIDGAVAEAMKRGKTNAAVSVMEGQRKPRAALAGERQRAAEALGHTQGRPRQRRRTQPPDRDGRRPYPVRRRAARRRRGQ